MPRGTRQRINQLAQRTGQRPLSLAAELLLLALRLVELQKGGEQQERVA